MVIHSTSAHCNQCNTAHPADIVRTDNRITAVVHCPKGELSYEVSSDADMFMKIRQKSSTNIAKKDIGHSKYVLNYISITNACNFSCAVCGVNAVSSDSNPVYLSADEIYHRAETVKKNGGRILHLIGGEPTLHPDILDIVERLSGMGFSTGVVTNGYLLGKDKGLALKLKERGLTRVCMQFDSLDRDTLDKLKRGYLDEKRRAIDNVIQAGLWLGLNCTTTKHNLYEIGELLAHGLELGICVKNMTFASAAPIGRFLFSDTDSADREQIISQLLTVGHKYNFSFDDVFPLPAYSPWGINTHPDCGAHVLFIRTPQGIRPVNHYVDIKALYKKMGDSERKSNFISKRVIPVYYLFKSARKGKLFQLLRSLVGLSLFKKRYSLVNVGISNYKAAAFLDEQRISRCASAFYTSVGPVKGCQHFFRDQSFPGSREYEVAHGGC